MLSFSQKVRSPSPLLVVRSSPIVDRVMSAGFPGAGDCMDGSGEVPQDELAPRFEFDEADGELWEVLWPLLICPLEAVLDLDVFVKKSMLELALLFTLSRSVGLNRAEKLDMSLVSSGVWFRPVLELLVD
jgi:hypothetical protein